ncbi:MAG TPA: hypothetical protein VN426_13640 [Syntrophomonadaceae bacterium]|nr:hypothetical protein [Syntrophomonadaceae bacterium]
MPIGKPEALCRSGMTDIVRCSNPPAYHWGAGPVVAKRRPEERAVTEAEQVPEGREHPRM